ncbi:tRNA pseudouridine(55) synthase TruB [Alicyclobacillus macrosporangiidus]|uniref:tRNA pseudouridine synthase B n=1 Tax=Alicyclobacillus macrosporangiidus TaxID=392015 RepID=A0A1I7IS85_9BACL|nr:tRNA pseudouridine(55) synthase TruB [Alicyclobacillus macrosporangiidus]SFU75763.1 tRNA pseudouridine55 synthase [Alicyclobacillus macrosporangiidus]
MPSGVLVLDKPAGLTSHDVVDGVRKVLGTRRVGHAGTLDPDVTGVLVICVGEATRLLEFAAAEEKQYEGVIAFGRATDTDDATGRVVAEADASRLDEAVVREAATALVGDVEQAVPLYAAVRVGGKRLYEYARSGEPVEPPVRRVRIEELAVLWFRPGAIAEAGFRVRCSKGTYVRALCRDWGRLAGVPAHMRSLRRTASGHFQIGEAVDFDHWRQSPDPAAYLLPPAEALRGWPRIAVTEEEAAKLAQGQRVVSGIRVPGGSLAACVTTGGELVAVVQAEGPPGAQRLRPKKVFWKKER